jgi:TPR repeat protein
MAGNEHRIKLMKCGDSVLVFERAKQGDVDAQYQLGLMYSVGFGGVAENDMKAKEWFESAAAQGHAGAYYSLGHIYHSGQSGVDKDSRKAERFFQKAAMLNHAGAAYWLGIIHGDGIDVPLDAEKSEEWLKKAVDLGSTDASIRLENIKNPPQRECVNQS